MLYALYVDVCRECDSLCICECCVWKHTVLKLCMCVYASDAGQVCETLGVFVGLYVKVSKYEHV